MAFLTFKLRSFLLILVLPKHPTATHLFILVCWYKWWQRVLQLKWNLGFLFYIFVRQCFIICLCMFNFPRIKHISGDHLIEFQSVFGSFDRIQIRNPLIRFIWHPLSGFLFIKSFYLSTFRSLIAFTISQPNLFFESRILIEGARKKAFVKHCGCSAKFLFKFLRKWRIRWFAQGQLYWKTL